ncbi:maleylpyruvate isomerase N-terminal domain-containing protein [Nocardiopsis sp. ATB16-24]|uniref:maleylpyruvate isomerase N-terminal domain-containing protein n=1 Tax=Nocardiopsis sp. ATB16-24 TaxID=3019555 RepID=UPI002556C5CD|nr:maleylpyruvate isomerase N-terminal domain-containing protein [Nocardiopsis sp. ATB16-24]
MDTQDIYTRCMDRMLSLAEGLSAEQLATPVPALPEWNVRQTYAHLAGICADVATERLTPPADDAATARQVAERAHMDITRICADWRKDLPALLRVLSTRTQARYFLPTLDLWHHENDVRGALGMEAQTEDSDRLAAFTVGGLARFWSPELPGVRVTATDTGQEWTLGDGTGPKALEWSATAFELARAATGRRSLEQMRAMRWSGDPSAVVEHLATLPIPQVDLRI